VPSSRRLAQENPYLGLPAKDAAEQAVIDAWGAAWWRGWDRADAMLQR
jgi:hypothetical protein